MYLIVWLRFQYLDYAGYEHQSLALTCLTLIFKRDFFLYFLFTFFFWGGGLLNLRMDPIGCLEISVKKITTSHCVITHKGVVVIIIILRNEQQAGTRWAV